MAAALPVFGRGGGNGSIQGFLHQLSCALQDPDPGTAALRGYHLIRSVGEACVTSTGDGARGACDLGGGNEQARGRCSPAAWARWGGARSACAWEGLSGARPAGTGEPRPWLAPLGKGGGSWQ